MRIWRNAALNLSARTPAQQHVRAVSTLRRIRIADYLETEREQQAAQPVTVDAFVRSVRKQKNIAFAALGDGSSLDSLQAVLDPIEAAKLSTGAAARFVGELKPSPPGKEQGVELHARSAEILGDHDATAYPLQKKYHSPEFLRTMPHLRSRTPHNSLLLRLRSRMIAQATRFFDEQGYIQTHTPIITSSDCEGAGEVFHVESNAKHSKIDAPDKSTEGAFFGAPKYLTVSSQLHLEALAQSVGHVWTLSPTFRAEESDTARHLSEFYMLEAEACFAKGLPEIMDIVEALIRSFAADLMGCQLGAELLQSQRQDNAENEVKADLQSRWKGLLMPNWPRITYHEAVQTIQKAVSKDGITLDDAVDAESGLQAEHERFIATTIGKGSPVFVTDYPASIKPFYMAPSTGPAEQLGSVPTASCFDLLMPDVCEVVGGSMREHRLDALEKSMADKGLLKKQGPDARGDSSESEGLDWYLDLRRYGSAPHGGFGMGFDRLLAYIAGVHNIRDVVTFPRWHGRCIC